MAMKMQMRAAQPCAARRNAAARRATLRVSAAAPAAAAAGAAKVIDGKKIAEDIRKEIAAEVQQIRARTGKAPGLAVVLVGTRKDSETYVRSKKKACAEVGFESFGADLPETATEDEVLAVVAGFNADPNVHGILVQLPVSR